VVQASAQRTARFLFVIDFPGRSARVGLAVGGDLGGAWLAETGHVTGQARHRGPCRGHRRPVTEDDLARLGRYQAVCRLVVDGADDRRSRCVPPPAAVPVRADRDQRRRPARYQLGKRGRFTPAFPLMSRSAVPGVLAGRQGSRLLVGMDRADVTSALVYVHGAVRSIGTIYHVGPHRPASGAVVRAAVAVLEL
jgi:hypothetical protein